MNKSIMSLFEGNQGQQIIEGISKQVGTSSSETKNVLMEALPSVLSSLQQNASNPSGAASLVQALSSKHDGSILDNLGDFFNKGGDEKDGNSILNHILGSKKSNVSEAVSAKSGVSSSQVMKIIALAAPVIMGYLGKQNKSKGNSSGGIGDLLGSLLGGSGNAKGGLSGMLDQNGDGKLGLDDLGGIMGSFMKKK